MAAEPSDADLQRRDDVRRVVAIVIAITVAGALLYVVLGLWVGWRDAVAAIRRLGTLALLGGPPVALCTYLLRFTRWQFILRHAGHRLPTRESFRIYLAGLALTATPGKSGETLRSMLLVSWGVPVGTSLAAFLVDRLSDLLGVLLLAAITAASWRWSAIAGLVLLAGFGLRWLFAAGRARRLAPSILRFGRFSWARRLLDPGMEAYAALWRARLVAGYLAIAFAAYGLQSLVFATYVRMLWPGAGIAEAVNVFAVASLTGAASLLPGGLGATELMMIALLTRDGMPLADATAAAVGARLVSLWFAVLLGLAALASFRPRTLRASVDR